MSVKASYLILGLSTVAATVFIASAPVAVAAPCDKLRIEDVFKHECGLRAISPPLPTTSANSVTDSGHQAEAKGSHK